MNSLEFIKKAKSGKINIAQSTKKTLQEVKKINKDHNYFLVIDEKADKQIKNLKKGRLYGLPVSIKDCIVVKDMESKAGSKILEGYNPVFDATIIKKLRMKPAL